MKCSQCTADNPETNKFCGECGVELIARPAPIPVPGDPGAVFCTRHKKTPTRLACGRCETPICPRCMVQSPAGIRCRDCSRNKIAVRPMAVLHEAGRVVENASQGAGRRVWYLALWYVIMSFFRNPFDW